MAKLKDLPKELHDLALKRATESQIGDNIFYDIGEESSLDGCFIFDKTPEGQRFWNKVDLKYKSKEITISPLVQSPDY